MATNTNTNGDATHNAGKRRNPEEYTKKFELNEIKPLDSEAQSNMVESANDESLVNNGKSPKKANYVKSTYENLLTRLHITKDAKFTFISLIVLKLLLVIVLFTLIIYWPTIPEYLTADVCVEKECIEASGQILLWTNKSADRCQQPFEWACGRFEDEHLKHDFYGMHEGEWNQRTYAEYNDIFDTHAMITKLISTRQSNKVHEIITGLYSSCMNLESIDKAQSESDLKKAMIDLSGWVYGSHENIKRTSWNFKDVLTLLHSKYGIFPFFKILLENRNPNGKIIAISNGDVGLPHKFLYNLKHDHKITIAYKMLLRDFAINFGIVSDLAKQFSDEVYHYERRLVNDVPEEHNPEILSLSSAEKLAATLPIAKSVKTIFSETTITDSTQILIRDTEALKKMANIVSTSTESVLNNFIIWSLARNFLPFMSSEYRNNLEIFKDKLYGHKVAQPQWYFCTNLVKTWAPYAVAVLKRKPELITKKSQEERYADSTNDVVPNYRDELLKIIFHHIRYQVKAAVGSSNVIDKATKDFIVDKLSETKLEIGIPEGILSTEYPVNSYYRDFLIQSLHFSDNIEWIWSFKKKKMQQQFKVINYIDKLIAELFPIAEENDDSKAYVRFSSDLNTIILSEYAVNKPYYHHNYPISTNFARIGNDIIRALFKAIASFNEENNIQDKGQLGFKNVLLENTTCIERYLDNSLKEHEHRSTSKLITEIVTDKFTFRTFEAFLENIERNTPIPEMVPTINITYDLLGLRQFNRQVGLREFSNIQLFSLSLLQRKCGVIHYEIYKPYIEGEYAEKVKFKNVWDTVSGISGSLSCENNFKC